MVRPTTPKTSSDEAREVGSAIRILRDQAGLTQEELADRFGVSRTSIQNYENGRSVVLRTDFQMRITAAMGRTRQDLIDILRGLQTGDTTHSGVEEPGAIYSGPGRQQAIFPTSQGDVIISYPANLSPESRQELSDYLAIFLKRAGG